ncbi:MAG: methylmalonyl Co-A mutase-associated GTPase MeaB [Phycisphaerales bacterium]|nr:methylmalonyl Co-A mutase-associated GTPase MeaB [Phycisphaerales bacterium]
MSVIALTDHHPQARPPRPPAPPPLSTEQMVAGVTSGDRAVLARAISLIESTNPAHAEQADEVLRALLPRTGRAVRIGITGVPGAGKSTFIERLGLMLCGRGMRIAVLAIDPSSTISGGSILGDRTRMGRLATESRAFIRPSPSGGTLGGVARRTREAGLLCEAAGFDAVLIETVGVGQSETVVADMCDCVLTLALPGSGDELQGVKRGLLEIVDIIAVNKADGDNVARARIAAGELTTAVRMLRAGAPAPVVTCSAATGEGVEAIWGLIDRHVEGLRVTGRLEARRREQRLRWMRSLIDDRLRMLLAASPAAAAALAAAEAGVRDSAMTPGAAARRVIAAFLADARGIGPV